MRGKIKQLSIKRGHRILYTLFFGALMMFGMAQSASAAILYAGAPADVVQQPTGSTEYSMQYGITGVTGTIHYITYFSDFGSCPLSGPEEPIVRINNPNAGGRAYNTSATTNGDGSCTYYDPTGDTVTGSDSIYIFFPNSGNVYKMYGSVADTASGSAQHFDYNTSGVTADSILADYSFTACDTSPCTGAGPTPVDTTTRITYVYPVDQSTVATGTIPVEIKGYLNSQDATSSTLQISITSKYNVYGGTQPSTGLLPGGVPLSADLYPVSIFQEFPLSGAGNFDVISSTTITTQGIMGLQAIIVPSNSNGSEAFWGTSTPPTATSTEFIVGTSTQADYIASYIAKAISLSTNATTTFPDCTLLSPDFIPCMLIPPLPLLNAVFVQFHDQVLARWPIGIATRIFDVMATTSTSSLPTITIITPHALGWLGDYEWDLNFEAMMSNTTSNPFLWTDIDWGGTRGQDGSTIWQVIGPIYTPIVYAFALIALALFVMWRHNKH